MAVNLSMRAESPASPDSPLLTAHDTSAGSLSADPDDSQRTTPGRRKNKRKMSEPRRLSDLEKRPRVEEDDSGVETTSAGSADKSPVDEVDAPKLPGMSYPPAIMVPAYLPYGYPYLNPALHGGQYAMHMMNAAGVPGAALPAHVPAPVASTSSSSRHASTPGRQAGGSSRQPGSSGTPVSGPASEKPSRGRKSSEKDRDSSPFHKSGQGPRPPPPVPVASGSGGLGAGVPPGPGGAGIPGLAPDDPRQYKTMTVERRVEANARERTRVHTISAAFEALRRAVPAYSYNQKLSKLAILRIACCYILSLSRLADKDYSRDQSRPSFGECVDLTTRTIQAEGRAKKRH